MEYFKAQHSCLTVRVTANEATRRGRGWVFVEDVDDAPSECALDDYQVDATVRNNSDEGEGGEGGHQMEEDLERIARLVRQNLFSSAS